MFGKAFKLLFVLRKAHLSMLTFVEDMESFIFVTLKKGSTVEDSKYYVWALFNGLKKIKYMENKNNINNLTFFRDERKALI